MSLPACDGLNFHMLCYTLCAATVNAPGSGSSVERDARAYYYADRLHTSDFTQTMSRNPMSYGGRLRFIERVGVLIPERPHEKSCSFAFPGMRVCYGDPSPNCW